MDSNMRPESMVRITTKELADAFIAERVEAVRAQVGDKKVLLALSGGVDSSVVAALLIKAIGKQLVCVHVNHGLMRKDESENVVKIFGDELDANLKSKEEALETAKNNLETFKTAVGDGYIYTTQAGMLADVDCKAGNILNPMSPVVTYYDTETISVEVSVEQTDIAQIKVGDSVMITGNSMAQGKVQMIETSRAGGSVSDVYYTVTVQADNSDGKISAGESVTVMFGMENMRGMNKEAE